MGENVIEWLDGDKRAAVTLSAVAKRKLTKLFEKFPDEVDCVTNPDGSVFGHVPIRFVKLLRPRTVELTEEQRAALAERLRAMRSGSCPAKDGNEDALEEAVEELEEDSAEDPEG